MRGSAGRSGGGGDDAARPAHLRQVRREEDHEEGRDEVVDALHVPGRRVAERPDVKDALERAPHRLGLEDARGGRAAAWWGGGGRERASGERIRNVRGLFGRQAGSDVRAWHVHQDLVQRVALVLRSFGVGDLKVLRHRLPVLAPLALQRIRAVLHVRRQVAQQQLPTDSTVLGRNAGPARFAQLGQVDHLDVRAQ